MATINYSSYAYVIEESSIKSKEKHESQANKVKHRNIS